MRKLLTAGIFGTILSLTGANYAGASIISRGFFDEAMENYATNTALDLKANQSDLTALSNKIGTLPSGDFPAFPGHELLFSFLHQPLTYPTSLAELINAIYGNSETGTQGLLLAIITGFQYFDTTLGIVPNYNLAKNANDLAKANADAIGTLPSGITVEAMFNGWKDSNGNYFPGIFNLNKAATTLLNTYHPSDNPADILIQGAENTTIDGVYYTGPVYPLWKLSEGIDKIGTLPPGYDNVGAALAAMESDINAKNLPSTSDDGQYVLTAKKVGNTITYTWVKMDLTSEEQAQ